MTDFEALTAAELKRWQNAKLTRDAAPIARRLVAAKQRYVTVQNKTGVPWFVIVVIHERESSQSWAGSLAQGDPWNKVSVHVPAGRGPFQSWEEAAIDALLNCHPYLGKRTDWSVAGTLVALNLYNGLGYAGHGVPSPYVWAGTDQYRSGKYVRDGVYDPNTVDKQMGCVAMLLAMKQLDPSIQLGGWTIAAPGVSAPPSIPQPVAPAKPSITNPAPGSIGAWFSSLFRRKS